MLFVSIRLNRAVVRGLLKGLVLITASSVLLLSALARQGNGPLVIEGAGESADLWVDFDGTPRLSWLDPAGGTWKLKSVRWMPSAAQEMPALDLPIAGDAVLHDAAVASFDAERLFVAW